MAVGAFLTGFFFGQARAANQFVLWQVIAIYAFDGAARS